MMESGRQKLARMLAFTTFCNMNEHSAEFRVQWRHYHLRQYRSVR
jgi:hypothetical protein